MRIFRSPFFMSYLLVLLIFALARYGAFPAIGFTLDDWWHLNLTNSFNRTIPLLSDAVRHPARPLGTVMLMANYKAYGEHIGRYLFDSMMGFALFLFLGMWLARRLVGSLHAAFIFGMLCALWPGYHQLFFWPNVMLGFKKAFVYMLLLATWVRFTETRQWRYYIFALFLYGWQIFWSEILLPIPIALAVLIPWNRAWLRQSIRLILPFGGLAIFYLIYRFTNAFGHGLNMLGTSQHFSSAFAANLWEIRHNVMAIASWFAGPELGRIWLNGLCGLRDIGPLAATLLVVLDVGLIWLAWKFFRQEDIKGPSAFQPLQVGVFGLVLAAFPAALLVLTYPAGRTLFYVAIGLFFVVCLTARKSWKHTSWLVPLLVLVMLSTQGMGKNWETGAEIQRQFRTHLEQHRTEWLEKEILLVDTSALRERMGCSLLDDPPTGFFTVAEYRGAGFLRGFGPSQIARRVAGSDCPIPQVLLDTEYGARLEDSHLIWHERFNPSAKRSTSLEQVYMVDMLTATRRLPSEAIRFLP